MFKIRWRDSSAVSPLKTFLPSSKCASTTPAENKSERLSVIWKSACSGTHEIGLAGDDLAFLVGQKPARLGDAEVRHLHVALERDHDVFQTHVAVDDAQRPAVLVGLGVRVGQPARDAADDEDGQFLRQLAFLVGELVRELLQIHAANQFHADETNALGLAEVIGLDDVRVNQVGDELGLADEVLDEHLLAGEIRADDLDGHALDEIARAVLLGLENDAHAAFKNLADDLVTKVALDGEKCHAGMVGNCAAKSSPAPGRERPQIFYVFLLARFRRKSFNSSQVA